MVLHIESDVSELSAPKSRSRAAGFFYLSDKPKDPNKAPKPIDPPPMHNRAIIREVLSSATEAELAGLFHNGKDACPMRIALEEMRHTQPRNAHPYRQ